MQHAQSIDKNALEYPSLYVRCYPLVIVKATRLLFVHRRSMDPLSTTGTRYLPYRSIFALSLNFVLASHIVRSYAMDYGTEPSCAAAGKVTVRPYLPSAIMLPPLD